MSKKCNSSPAASQSLRCAAPLFAATALLVACGGGGSGDGAPAPAPSVAPTNAARASVVTPATGKTAWSLDTPATFSLINGSGVAVTGALTCSSDSAVALTVAADCSSLKGTRLGNQTVTVSGGGVSAKATIKVIPQPQPIGTNAYTQNYNLVVTPDGKVLAWGENRAGATLGQGKSEKDLPSLSLPTLVKAPSGQGALDGIVAASAGGNSAYALTEDGEVYSWGSGSFGTLGRPFNTSQGGETLPGKVTSPTGSGTLQKIVSVSAGQNNVIALADDGTVFYWGSSLSSGQASGPDAKAPITVPGLPGPVVAVSAGFAWNAVLLADGRVMTWGFNDGSGNASGAGNLGRGIISNTDARTAGFVLDKSSGLPMTGIVSVSAGRVHGLALNAVGQVYAWGWNENGAIGQGDLSNRPDYPLAVLVKAPSGATTWSGVKMVAAGGFHSLAVDVDGKVFSWGYSQDGQLGDGANHPRSNSSSLPAAVVNLAGIGQLSDVSAVAAGYGHSLALANDGRLLIWGYDGGVGNLGQGSTVVKAIDNGSLSYVPLTVKNEAGAATLTLSPINYWPNLTRRGIF